MNLHVPLTQTRLAIKRNSACSLHHCLEPSHHHHVSGCMMRATYMTSSIKHGSACCACRHKLLLHAFVNAPALTCFLPAVSTLFRPVHFKTRLRQTQKSILLEPAVKSVSRVYFGSNFVQGKISTTTPDTIAFSSAIVSVCWSGEARPGNLRNRSASCVNECNYNYNNNVLTTTATLLML